MPAAGVARDQTGVGAAVPLSCTGDTTGTSAVMGSAGASATLAAAGDSLAGAAGASGASAAAVSPVPVAFAVAAAPAVAGAPGLGRPPLTGHRHRGAFLLHLARTLDARVERHEGGRGGGDLLQVGRETGRRHANVIDGIDEHVATGQQLPELDERAGRAARPGP